MQKRIETGKPSKWLYPLSSGATFSQQSSHRNNSWKLFVIQYTVFTETSAFPNSGFLCAFCPLILFLNAKWFRIRINRLAVDTFSYFLFHWLFCTVSICVLCWLVCFCNVNISRKHEHFAFFFYQEKEAFITSQLKAKGLTMRDEKGDDMNSENLEQ